MNTLSGRVRDFAATQHGVVAIWQLHWLGFGAGQVKAALRGLPRIYQGVCLVGDELSPLGRLMAAALVYGPEAALSHLTAVQMSGMRPLDDGSIHVSVPCRSGLHQRPGTILHRRSQPFPVWRRDGIPFTPPARALTEAALDGYALYRALEEAGERGYAIDVASLDRGIVRLQRAVAGRTRSDAEAMFLLLCRDHGIRLPLVNHRLNGFVTDFHWPAARLVVEVDGWEFHRSREQFEEDRWRGLGHRIAGYEVIRASAAQVMREPARVAAAVLAAAPRLGAAKPRCRGSRAARA